MVTAHRLTALDGAELAYWVWPCTRQPAPAVLEIHGAASNHTRWSEFNERTSLRDRYDLVCPDMRGNGRSMVRARLDLPIWCRDLEQILAAEGQSRAIVVGHSLGAQIAVHFAAERAARVRALVLIDPVVRQALRGRRRLMSRLEPLFWIATWIFQGLNRIGFRRRQFPLCDLRSLDEATRAAMQGEHPQEELVRRYSSLRPILRHMPIANYLQQLVATAAPLPPLENIVVPVLVLESAGVDFADRETTRAELARLRQLERQSIDATHWPITERPDDVRRAIEEWIERLDAAL